MVVVDTLSPPQLTCTVTEYQEILSLASSIESYEDAQQELLDCSRYGDLESVRALLEVWSKQNHDFVNIKNDTGCTALHFAAANGHTSVVHLLLSAGALHIKNQSGGNTPLHWAAQNSHTQVIQLLLHHPPFRFHSSQSSSASLDKDMLSGNGMEEYKNHVFTGIDVLEKNDYGISALTEGFGSRNRHQASSSLQVTSSSSSSSSMDVATKITSNQEEDESEKEEEDQHTKLIGMLLEHDSATEDRLIGSSLKEENVKDLDRHNSENMETDQLYDENNSVRKTIASSSITNRETAHDGVLGVIHEFNFSNENIPSTSSSIPVLVRELPIVNADSPFGSTASEDTTGLAIWCASLVLSRWLFILSTVHRRFDDKVILELGAGCGTPGLTVALCSRAHTIYLSDFNTATMENLQFNIELNSKQDQHRSGGRRWADRVVPLKMDWDDSSTWPTQPIDCLIGSDLIYQKTLAPKLKNIITNILTVNGSFFYVCPSDGRDGVIEFIQEMSENELSCINQFIAPAEFRDNPLSSKDEEAAFLHFYELPVTEYILYEFIRKV